MLKGHKKNAEDGSGVQVTARDTGRACVAKILFFDLFFQKSHALSHNHTTMYKSQHLGLTPSTSSEVQTAMRLPCSHCATVMP